MYFPISVLSQWIWKKKQKKTLSLFSCLRNKKTLKKYVKGCFTHVPSYARVLHNGVCLLDENHYVVLVKIVTSTFVQPRQHFLNHFRPTHSPRDQLSILNKAIDFPLAHTSTTLPTLLNIFPAIFKLFLLLHPIFWSTVFLKIHFWKFLENGTPKHAMILWVPTSHVPASFLIVFRKAIFWSIWLKALVWTILDYFWTLLWFRYSEKQRIWSK